MVALLKQINGDTRQRLMAGHELLHCALAEIVSLVHACSRDHERLILIIDKVNVATEQLRKRDLLIQRYESLHREISHRIRQLAADNAALHSLVQQQDRAHARALLVVSMYRATHSVKSLAETNAAPEPVEVPRQSDSGDERYSAKVDLAVAMLVEADDDALRELMDRARELGLVMSRNELMEAIDSLDLPLGTPAEAVHVRYRERFAEVHPDRHKSASGAMERMLQAQRMRLNLARDIHFRYLGTRTSTEES
jgi:hypothetical protein